jgi:hypothetical protein
VRAPQIMAMTRNSTVPMKVKIPYGIAKKGFFNLPVAHPRSETRMPTTPIVIFPFPIPAPSPSPGILNFYFC